jgi:hypothetical protein
MESLWSTGIHTLRFSVIASMFLKNSRQRRIDACALTIIRKSGQRRTSRPWPLRETNLWRSIWAPGINPLRFRVMASMFFKDRQRRHIDACPLAILSENPDRDQPCALAPLRETNL